MRNLGKQIERAVAIAYHRVTSPVGIEALAATLSEESATLAEVVEPYLLQIGFLARTPGGRKATYHAYQHLGVSPPSKPGQAGLDL